MANRKVTMDKGYDKELADAVKRGKQIRKQMEKAAPATKKKTVKRSK